MTTIKRKTRCAIYTRKSHEDGLEQEFNSLDAQYEACTAYIQSQRSEGWMVLPDRYDDGGFSGGNIERPALKRLLKDIDNGLLDVIIVYKIDQPLLGEASHPEPSEVALAWQDALTPTRALMDRIRPMAHSIEDRQRQQHDHDQEQREREERLKPKII